MEKEQLKENMMKKIIYINVICLSIVSIFDLFWPAIFILLLLNIIILLIFDLKHKFQERDAFFLKIVIKKILTIAFLTLIVIILRNILIKFLFEMFISVQIYTLSIFIIFSFILSLINIIKNKKYILLSISSILLFLIFLFIIFLFYDNIKNNDPKYLLSHCAGNLREIGKACEIYYNDYKNYPSNIEILYELNYLNKVPRCPVSNDNYIIKNNKKFIRIECPNPEMHIGSYGGNSKTKELYYKSKEGVFQIDKKNILLKK